MKEPIIGFVILNYKTWEKTILCVDNIIKTCLFPKVILIVDNASPNDSFKELYDYFSRDQLYKEVILIQSERNGGFSYGNNFGFEYIRSNYREIEYVVLTNNDILFQAGCIERLISDFNIVDDVAITAPAIYDTNKSKTNNPWIKKPSILQNFNFLSSKKCHINWDKMSGPQMVYMVSGCCFVVDAEKFEQVNKLDDSVFLYNEENILSNRIANKGFKIIADPNAAVIHDHGSTTGNSSIFVDKEYVKSSLYFCRKYECLSKFSGIILWMALSGKMCLKAILRRYSSNTGLLEAIRETSHYI